MAFDGGFLSAVRCEMQPRLLGCRVDKIYQPARDELVLQLRSKEYFTFHCPRCHEASLYAHPMLYYDAQKRFMLVLSSEDSALPHEEGIQCVHVHTGEDFIESLRFLDDGFCPPQIDWIKARLQRRYPQAKITYDCLENGCLWFMIEEGSVQMPAGVPVQILDDGKHLFSDR